MTSVVRRSAVLSALVAVLSVLGLVTLPGADAASQKPLLGGASQDWGWYNANIGRAGIYRTYDSGFHYATWQRTPAYHLHGSAPEDYSFNLPPAALANGAYDGELKRFLSTTPKDLILTNYHEPEQEIAAGKFTAAQFRNAIAHLANLVHAQNAADGGHRRVSVILMRFTVMGFKGRNPNEYWPGRNPATGRNYADLVSFDMYGVPHNTNTPCCPTGFTDGSKWQTAQQLLDPVIAFASKIGSPWMVSEFGFLEDRYNATRKGSTITDFVNYAGEHGAVACEYWDGVGGHGDWRLRHSQHAVEAWRAAVHG